MSAGSSPDPRALLAQASTLHRSGRMEEALVAYREAARQAPRFLDAHRRLAFALLQAGHPKEAVRAASKARDLAPRDPNGHVLLGAGLLVSGEHAKALAAFNEAARLAPGLLEAHFQAGNALAAMGRHEAAVERFTRALEIDPHAPEPRMNRATAYARLGRDPDALADCDLLIAMQPWEATHLINKAGTLLSMGDMAGALTAAEAALVLAPDQPAALHVAGQAKAALDDIPGAIAALGRAVELQGSEKPDWRVRFARVLRVHDQFAAALEQCELALRQAPRLIDALIERAEVLRAMDQPMAALADLDRALALQPDATFAHLARSGVLGDLGRARDARLTVERAVRTAPREPRVLFVKALSDLGAADWRAGWANYETREHISPPPFTPPAFARWDGLTSPADLVVVGEQGIGDVILFGRLLPLLADRGLPVRFHVKPALAHLAARFDSRIPIVTDISGIAPDAPGTFWVPLASLPGLFAPEPALWPTVPYLAASEDRVAKWSTLKDRPGLRVGINWQGNPSRLLDIGRSAPLSAFAPLAAIPGVTLVSLQHGPAASQIQTVPFGGQIVFFGDDFDADGIFADRAGAMANLDLIISTDTSAAHLAGAMGRPGIVALRAVPDWRWGEEGEHSLFYPTLRLFRQTRAGDWDELFGRIAVAVRQLVDTRPA